jgi:hypothetical protein
MPKEAARIWLEILDVKCDRIQSITEEEAKAEGVETKETKLGPSYWDYETGFCNGLYNAKDSYRTLWKQRHGPDSWNNNDFAFSCNFKVLSTTGKPSYL